MKLNDFSEKGNDSMLKYIQKNKISFKNKIVNNLFNVTFR